MTVRIFRLTPMRWSSFTNADDLAFLADRGVVVTDSPAEADLIVSDRFPISQHGTFFSIAETLRHRLAGRMSKPMLIWTHEPRSCIVFEPYRPARGIYPPRHFMNVYTGDVCIGNLSPYGTCIGPALQPVTDPAWRRGPGRPIAALSTYLILPDRFRITRDGRNIDLAARRQRLMLAGWRRGLVDVYGYRWPKRIRTDDSRWNQDWHSLKLAILQNYRFNICLENTIAPGYCTEKLWDAIHAQTLPIYWGEGTRIYDDFPQDSFIDVARFQPMHAVFDFIEKLSDDEYLRRLNACIAVYNRVGSTGEIARQREQMLLNIVEKVHQIAGQSFI